MLFLITKDGNEIDKQEINDFLLEKVVKWWLPDDIMFVSELPHGATGKLLKVELREQYKDHLMAFLETQGFHFSYVLAAGTLDLI